MDDSRTAPPPPPANDRDIPEECQQGMHSWIAEVGLLPPDTECTHCGETYGHPD